MQPASIVSQPADFDRQRAAAKISVRELSVAYAGYPECIEKHLREIPAGHIVAVVGPSGCGKSTLLRAIAGLLQPSTGTIEFTPTLSPQTGQLAYVFQSPTLLPWRNVDENIALPLEIASCQAKSRSRLVASNSALSRVRIAQSNWVTKLAKNSPENCPEGCKCVPVSRAPW